MDKEIKLSIVLPSLNVVEYIRECMESVIHQSLQDIEIICVDAYSTDGTLEILKEYVIKDKRIKLLLADKKSYGYQMNLGIGIASGEYIGIVETDDYIPANMYSELYSVAKKNDNVDFVKADFFRFTGQGKTLHKTLHRLTQDDTFYNRVIDPRKEPECFRFIMNTWSGIYRKDFLQENNIRHNETPGASFQDTGFWFQTFSYAKKVFFVNKSYYMNRRDNIRSSVYSKEKVFSVCDEYKFIENILKKNADLFQRLKFIYSFFCFQAYNGTLNRIADKYKKSFLQRFSEDFCRFRDEGMLDYRMFGSINWNILLSIIDDPEGYYKQDILLKKRVFDKIRSYKSVIIYGAGGIGGRTLYELTYNADPVNVLCFAVSQREDNCTSYQGIPVYDIHDLIEYREKSLVVIATTKKYQKEIYETLKKLGFLHVIEIPENLGKDELYYRALNVEEYPNELEKWYKRITGEKLNLKLPVTFHEKQQWMKIYNVTELKKKLSDKVEMRKWVAERIGEKYLVPILGVYDHVEMIDFNRLPDCFVLKFTHQCGRNIFIHNKKDQELFKPDVLRRRLCQELNHNYAFSPDAGLDLIYDNITPRILVEEVVEGKVRHDSLKIICFDGEPVYIVVDSNKKIWGSMRRDVFDVFWNHVSVNIKYPNANTISDRPEHFSELLSISRKLAKDFHFCVIHFFDTREGVLFNKIKFSFANGVERITPFSFSVVLGNYLRCENN